MPKRTCADGSDAAMETARLAEVAKMPKLQKFVTGTSTSLPPTFSVRGLSVEMLTE